MNKIEKYLVVAQAVFVFQRFYIYEIQGKADPTTSKNNLASYGAYKAP